MPSHLWRASRLTGPPLSEYQKIVEEWLEQQEIDATITLGVGIAKPGTVGALMTPRA